MRPLIIVHTEASLGWGGQEIRIFTEMQAMRARGHRLLLAAQPSSEIFQRAKAAGFDLFPFTEKPLLFPYSILRLAFWLKKNGPDVVNTHSSKDGWIGGIAARLAGIPCIIRSKHIDVDYPRKFSSRIAYGVLPHQVLTTSLKIRHKISKELKIASDRITNLPTGIDQRLFQGEHSTALHTELGISPNVPLVGMISVIRSWKGHRFFLEAAAELLKSFPDIRFIIAGDGPGYSKLLQRIDSLGLKEKVICLGHRQDVARILQSLRLLVLPSIAHEGVPQIILQAQLSRCPVVGTTIGGIPEVIEEGITGRLVPPADPLALAAAIGRALREIELTNQMAGKAYERCLQENTMDVMCDRLEFIYQDLLKNTSS